MCSRNPSTQEAEAGNLSIAKFNPKIPMFDKKLCLKTQSGDQLRKGPNIDPWPPVHGGTHTLAYMYVYTLRNTHAYTIF